MSLPSEHEWIRRLWPAAAFQFAFVGTITLWKAAANAAVLARFDAQALPYLYIIAALGTAVMTGYLASLRERKRPAKIGVVGAVIVLGLGAALHFRLPVAPLAMYLFAEAFATYLSIVFWGAVGEAFDAREAKRAFTLVSGIGMAGGVLGGLLAQELATRVGVSSLLVVGSLLLSLGAYAFRFHRGMTERAIHRGEPTRGDLWQYVKGHGYAQALAALVISLAVLSAFADYLFRERSARMLDEDQMAALFGGLQFWMGLFCVAWQLLLAQLVLRRLGVIKYLALLPGLLVPFSVAALFEPGLWPAYGLKLVETAANLSMTPVALQLLYGPVPDELRDRLRSVLDGLVKKGGLALGGVLLILGASYASGPLLAGMVLGLCVVAGLAVLWIRPLYLLTLQERVSGAQVDEALEHVTDEPLREALYSPSHERVLHALSLMEQADMPLVPHLPILLDHPHPRVQERGIALAAQHGAVELSERVEALVGAHYDEVRVAAVWALPKLNPSRMDAVLGPLIDSENPELKSAAVGAILAYGQPSELWQRAEAALQHLIEVGELSGAEERRASAELLGKAKDERWAPFLIRYLQDADPSVRSAAIAAVGEGRYLVLAPHLFPLLASRDERRVAREALTQLGEGVVPMLKELMNDRAQPSALRYAVPRVLRQIGTQSALEALLFSNVADDAFLHYRVGVALSRLREEKPELAVDAHWVLEAIGRRRETYRTLVGPYRDVRAALGDDALLSRALGDRLDQAFELSFWLLGLLHDAVALRRVHAHLVGSDRRRHAWAREFLDQLLPHDEWELIREQVEAHHRELPLGAPGRFETDLSLLCQSDDFVLRSCARQVARSRGLWDEAPQEGEMSDTIVQRMFALEGVEIFAQCDVDDVAAVAALAREQSFKGGERIYDEGDPGDALYVIIRGSVDALRNGSHVLTLYEKQAFGDVSLLDGSPRPTEMIAAEDCLTLVIDRRDFLDLVSDRPELLKGIYRAVSQQLRQMLDLPARRATGETPRVGTKTGT